MLQLKMHNKCERCAEREGFETNGHAETMLTLGFWQSHCLQPVYRNCPDFLKVFLLKKGKSGKNGWESVK
jgi:hypothetical protein